MPDPIYYLLTAVVFLTMISILVAAHELGHYLFARLFGMGVEEFAVGMLGKKPLWTYARRRYLVPLPKDTEFKPGDTYEHVSAVNALEGGLANRTSSVVQGPEGPALDETTDFTIRQWPIGGFVRITGMQPEEDGSEIRVPGGFYSKPPWQRLIVLFAGPLFSVLAGIAILIPLYMFHGIDRPSNEPVINSLVQGSQADKAGVKPGDRIVSVAGKPVATFYDYLSRIRDRGGETIEMVVDRAGEVKTLQVVPKWNDFETPVLDEKLNDTGVLRRQAILGIPFPRAKPVPVSFAEANVQAWRTPIQAVAGLASIFRKPSTFKDSVGGPGTMIAATNLAVRDGITTVFKLAALLSISVGIMNLLPIFPLDGGQMAVAFVELFRSGRRLSMRVQNLISTVGFGFVVLLFGSVLLVDFSRFALPADPKNKPPVILDGKTKPKPATNE